MMSLDIFLLDPVELQSFPKSLLFDELCSKFTIRMGYNSLS